MSAVIEVREPSVRYLASSSPFLMRSFEKVAGAAGATARLRELILDLALRGKLVPQDSRDEHAGLLLERIRAVKANGAAGGRAKASGAGEISGHEPPHDLPPSWSWTSLSAIGQINPRIAAEDSTTASFVPMSSIPIAFTDTHVGEPRPWRDIKAGFTQFADGDVGVAKITPCFENGKSTVFKNLHNGIGAGTTELHIVRPLCGIEPRYVLLFLKSPRFLHVGETVMTGTAGQKRLPRAFFENCPFPLPPLPEQARIVARVDEMMRLCDALEEKGRLEAEQHARLLSTLLGTLTESTTPEELAANWQRVAEHFDLLLDRPAAVDALEASILELAVRGLLVGQSDTDEPAHQLLGRVRQRRKARRKIVELGDEIDMGDVNLRVPAGWAWASVDELSDDEENAIADGPFGANLKTEHYINKPGFRVIRLQNIGAGVFKGEHEAFIDGERFDRLSRHHVRAGDIVVAGLVDESIRCCIVPEQLGPALVKADCYRYAVHPEVSAEYVCLYLSSMTAHEFASIHHHGLTLTRIGLGNFRSIPVLLPPPSEQARIVARVTELRRLCTTLRQRLQAQQATQSRLAEALVERATT